MSITVSPLTLGEKAFLRRTENEDLLYHYLGALVSIHGLAARYTGSMYFVMVPDETEALEILNGHITALEAVPGLARRMRGNAAACHALRKWACRVGDTTEVREAAARLMQECSDEREWLYGPDAGAGAARHAVAG